MIATADRTTEEARHEAMLRACNRTNILLAETYRDRDLQVKLWRYYQDHVADWIDDWVLTYDPREDPANLPMQLWPKQREFISWLEAIVDRGGDAVVEKSRDFGASWLCIAFAAHRWIFRRGFKANFASNKADKVDRLGDYDSLFEKLRHLLRELPPWQLPPPSKRIEKYMTFLNEANGSGITGESGRDIGRGGRCTVLFLDEAAFLEHADSANAASAATARCRIWLSTPNGQGNQFAIKRFSLPEDRVFVMDWHAQPLDAKILTPTGWRLMGEIKAGDQVIGTSGDPVTVSRVTPQGHKEVYRMQFSDGASTECCGDHLWTVIPCGNHRAERRHITKIVALKDVARDYVREDSRGHKVHRYQIPLASPVIGFNRQSLPVDPYVLGCLLGDGSLEKQRVCLSVGDEDAVEMCALVNQRLPTDCCLKPLKTPLGYYVSAGPSWRGGPKGRGLHNPIKAAIAALGLSGTKAHTKFVPEPYKTASVHERLELLRGLMDTDGCVARSDPGVARLTTTSLRLAEDTAFAAQSLGGVGKIRTRKQESAGIFPGNRVCSRRKDIYVVDVRLPGGVVPFKLSRKTEAYVPAVRYPPRRSLINIELVGVKECQCISVTAENGLYLTDDCIVTHNSDPRKSEAWARQKREEIGAVAWAREFDRDYAASVEGIIIRADWVLAAVELHRRGVIAPGGPVVCGLDVGGGGSGKTVHVVRRGPVIEMPVSWTGGDTTADACRAADLTRAAATDVALFYDSIGVGMGVGSTLERIRGVSSTGVNVGEPATHRGWPDGQRAREKFTNYKAEIWWTMRDRFLKAYEHRCFLDGEDGGVEHPTEDLITIPPEARTLQMQLSQITAGYRETGKISVESKDSLKRRGIPSPDEADALALTFAEDRRGFSVRPVRGLY